MRYLDADQPYQKVWLELQAMAWNRPEYRERIARVHAAWREAMRQAVSRALARYKLDSGPFSTDEWITLIVTMNEGVILERLTGVDQGHAALLDGIDRWLSSLEASAVETETRTA